MTLNQEASFCIALTLCDQAQNIVTSFKQRLVVKIIEQRYYKYPPVSVDYDEY